MQSAKRVNIVSIKLVKESSILYKERKISSPKDSFELLHELLENKDREHFIVVALNTKNEPVSINVCHIGSLNSSIVHPREIMKVAILSNAASILVAHNHPSGSVTPSPEDIQVTERLKKAGELMGIELLDHLIIGDNTYLSLKEKGYI
ncbi:RadC family protein [Bacillus toyonensis]|uniref:RadC family protein n=1 Tax=Bacillus toyonensis TaxID=155322 RepID=UPI002541010E|nr:DNA repair protein RadC [Bacillus toyonensis]WIG41987.1 DNA repair protein RadC [Bacillus toyonensis]